MNGELCRTKALYSKPKNIVSSNFREEQ
jgi:hypothetical protein